MEMGLFMDLTNNACEGNEVLRGRFCRRAGRRGSTAGETPAATNGSRLPFDELQNVGSDFQRLA